jgi:hypothetical protein
VLKQCGLDICWSLFRRSNDQSIKIFSVHKNHDDVVIQSKNNGLLVSGQRK